MDAKPHRPLRAFKVQDENLPPTVLPGKTLHQRNKSSPALSTLGASAAMRAGMKRAVFADVSNTARGVQSFKDDSAITVKPLNDYIKEDVDQENNKAAPLLRPAQRPLSVSGLKGLLNSFASGGNHPKQSLTDINLEPNALSLNQRKTLSKRATTVFREPEPIPSILPELPSINTERENGAPPVPPAHQDETFKTRSNSHPQIQYPHRQSVIQSHGAYQILETINSNDYPQDVRSDDIPLDPNLVSQPHVPEPHVVMEEVEIYEDAPSYVAIEPINSAAEHETSTKVGQSDPLYASIYPKQELEDYWEEEAFEEQYEDDGYTTAKSFKSRGDYTTGQTTVVLAPKLTARAEKELAEARQLVEESKTAEEIEEDESWDTSMVSEYGYEIFEYMRTLETRMRPNPYYMDNQTEVQWSMRSVLMDWLVQVHGRFSLLPETLFLCVNYIDRFLSCKVVSLGKLQLVGATAIFIAAKYEEINCPTVQEIVFMVDGGYTVDEILKAERFMLSMLQFELGWPGPMSFLRRISKADDYDLETRTLAKYFLEISIMDERFVGCIPSFTAAGAHCLARLMLKKGQWTAAHVYYSNYTYSQLRPLLLAMLSCCNDPQRHHAAIFDKYGDKRFKRASYFVQSELNKGFVLPSIVPRLALPSLDFGRESRFK